MMHCKRWDTTGPDDILWMVSFTHRSLSGLNAQRLEAFGFHDMQELQCGTGRSPLAALPLADGRYGDVQESRHHRLADTG